MTNHHKSIGGYFGLELPQGAEYHGSAIALNTGRNCLEYILRVRGYRRVYLSLYSCDVLLEPFVKLGIDYTFYHINEHLELAEDIILGDGEALLYVNYYGLKQRHVDALAERYGKRLIVDNTQAFYARPLEDIDTFYSCRKFFGVADGAYLYCDKPLDIDLERDRSWDRMTHLLKRVDISPEAAYADFTHQDELLKGNPMRTMSTLSRRIMMSIDYPQASDKRRENFTVLDSALKHRNAIALPMDSDAVPMVYPFLTTDPGLRQRLIDNKVYVATYWPNVKEWGGHDTLEYTLSCNLLPLPVDQRYGTEDMKRILQLI